MSRYAEHSAPPYSSSVDDSNPSAPYPPPPGKGGAPPPQHIHGASEDPFTDDLALAARRRRRRRCWIGWSIVAVIVLAGILAPAITVAVHHDKVEEILDGEKSRRAAARSATHGGGSFNMASTATPASS
ncbi:hypothetical protein JCM10450v2_006356 [Rhodotorula kratochvilovae]